MGGASAPDDFSEGVDTQAWLAVSDDPSAMVSGEYFFHRQSQAANIHTRDTKLQDELLNECARLSKVILH
jgi:hypothetical protein